MADVFKVSQSKVKTYRRCRRAYHNKYVRKLRRKRVKRALKFGQVIHTVFEEYANGGDFQDTLDRVKKEQGKLFKAELEEYGDILDDMRVILTDYTRYWGEEMRYVRFKGKGSEFLFEVEIADNLTLGGKLDAIGQTRNKLKWLVEHKSGARMPNEDARWRNPQSSIYLRVIDLLKVAEVEGTCWDFIRSKAPTTPAILKSGEVSSRDIDTLPTRVDEFLKGHDLDPSRYVKLISLAEANQKNYFSRIFTPTKPRIVDMLWDEFVGTAVEMQKNHGSVKEMNIDRHCDWCDYEGLCRAELLGQDTEFVEKREYVVSEKHEEEEPDFEI